MPWQASSSKPSTGSLSAEAYDHALQLCRKWDKNEDGVISREELGVALKQIFTDCEDRDVEAFVRAVDVNRDGLLQYSEVLDWLRQPPRDSRCFEDAIKSYMRDPSRKPVAAGPSAAKPALDEVSPSGEPRLWDSRLLHGFTHPLLERFHVSCELVSPASNAPSGSVNVRFLARGVRSSDGDVACTAALRRDAGSGRTIDVSMRTVDYSGDGIQRLYTTLRHFADVHFRILGLFATTFADREAKSACLRLEPAPVVGRDRRESLPVPLAYWSAMALAIARLSPAVQAKLAKARIELCVGSDSASAEYRSTLEEKLQAARKPVGSDLTSDGPLLPRQNSWNWVRQENNAEARLCRLQAFLLTQRVAFAGLFDFGALLGKPGKPATLKQVDRMLRGTTLKRVDPWRWRAGESTAGPSTAKDKGKTSELCTPVDLGLPENITVTEAARVLTSKFGRKVAAVNAASAYSVGGGCSSGGRHALEEAWCTTSTVFRSLSILASSSTSEGAADSGAAGAAASAAAGAGAGEKERHVPLLGCIVSPSVEVFREGTERGYGLLPEPICLCGVLSVAMFNRNPSVADSPLDCPEDPSIYVSQTLAKLESVVLAAGDLGADVLVVPDVGCGVFQNDAQVVGGCLGAVLRRHCGIVRQVLLLPGTHQNFVDACNRVFRGEDPREPWPEGANSTTPPEGKPAARFLRGPSLGIEAGLVAMAGHPEQIRKSECRYGALCRIKDPRHLGRFLHPPPAETIPWPEEAVEEPSPACAGAAAPSRPAEAPQPLTAVPPGAPLPVGAALARAGLPVPSAPSDDGAGKPTCKFGEACYRRDPKHMQEFAHPWAEGKHPPAGPKVDVPVKESAEDNKQVHEMLTLAKAGSWDKAKAMLRLKPEFVDRRPDVRSFGLVHHAAWQIRMDEMEALVLDFGADTTALTKEGRTPLEVLKESLQLGGLKPEDLSRAAALEEWLKKRAAGASATSRPVSASGVTPSASPRPAGSPTDKDGNALKPGGSVLRVCSCLKAELEGEYTELAKVHNGYPAYFKAPDLYIYYNFRTSLGWAIDKDMSNSSSPLAYLGISMCGSDPTAKRYGEAWKVLLNTRIAPGAYTKDEIMSIKRKNASSHSAT